MSAFYKVSAISSPGKLMSDVRANEGVETIAIPMTRAITPIADLGALWRLYRLFKKEKPLIVHTHTPKAGLLGMMAAWLARVPVRMHTVAGLPLLEATGLKRKVLNLVEKITYACAHKVYPNSFRLKQIISEEGFCHASKVAVIGNGSSNGIDTTFFSGEQVNEQARQQLKGSLGIAEGDMVFCFVGRMVKDKGINELVTVFVELQKSYPGLKLILTGPFENDLDPVLPAIEQTIRSHPAIKWVDYQNDVRPYLAISDVFVFPSYREGFPNVVLQAGAMGLPCIVSNINGCNEIIENGQNGIIVEPKSTSDLQEAMQYFVTNSEARRQMAARCRSIIVSRYQQEFLWEELLKEYKKLEANISQG